MKHEMLTYSLFALLVSQDIQASPFRLEFQFSKFGVAAPADPVSGTLIFESASANSPIEALTSFDLAIAGHAYALSEVGFSNSNPFFNRVGGLINGVNGLGATTDDFWMIWQLTDYSNWLFEYGTASGDGLYSAALVDRFVITPYRAVPEPAPLSLIGFGAAGLAVARRRTRSIR